jgi:DNA-binding beta-propeller fold protein YncE
MRSNHGGAAVNRATRYLMICLLTAAVGLIPVGGAAAAPGQISFATCLANSATQICDDLPGAPLRDAQGVAVSPDGTSVYVTSAGSYSIAHFRRDPSYGRLAWGGCLGDAPTNDCTDLPGSPLDGAQAVAVSPDGKSVYVTADDAVAHFARDARSGSLAWVGCFANSSAQGCVEVPGQPLGFPRGVAVSADGKSVYVVSSGSDSIAHFTRSPATGRLTYAYCVADDQALGCAPLEGSPLNGARAVAVSPDGKSVYVASTVRNSISHFLRSDPDGVLIWDRCLASAAGSECIGLPGSPLNSATGVAVSPDGKSVYVTSTGSASVSHFVRSAVDDGRLTYAYCVGNDASNGCVDASGDPLMQAKAVAVSPDGKSVYVTSTGSDSISHLFRSDPDGVLIWGACHAGRSLPGCFDLPVKSLDGPEGVAVSPDGTSVYVVSARGNSIAHFLREAAPPPADPRSPSQDPGGPRPPSPVPPPADVPRGFQAKTRVTLALSAKRVAARGAVRVRVSNRNPFTVRGRLSGQTAGSVPLARGGKRRVRLGAKSFSVAPTAATTVRLTLPRRLRALLSRKAGLPLHLTAVVQDPTRAGRTVTRRVVLRPGR